MARIWALMAGIEPLSQMAALHTQQHHLFIASFIDCIIYTHTPLLAFIDWLAPLNERIHSLLAIFGGDHLRIVGALYRQARRDIGLDAPINGLFGHANCDRACG
eukprot:Sdes_comp9896_c0_seq1m1437